jgi:hypothetical protein
MVRSSRTFKLATQASVDEKNAEYEDIEYTFEDPDAEKPKGQKAPVTKILTAKFPGDGAMIIMAASVGMDDAALANPAGALFSFLRQAFPEPGDFKFLKEQIAASRLDLRDDVMDMVGDMMETWSGVPTRQ